MSTDTPAQEDLTDVQERLFEMLNSVSLDSPRPQKTLTESKASSAPVATVEAPPEKKTPVRRHPTDCSNCGASEALKSSTWCESCGFHPRLNRCLEVAAPVDSDENQELTVSDMLQRVPMWAWIMGGGIASIIVFGAVLRGGLPDIQDRSPLALSMIFCGLLSLAICHVRAFYIGLQNSEKFNLGTMIAHPVETWRPAAMQLPDTRRLFYGMSWGLTAVTMAIAIVGIDWNGLFKPTPRARKSFNPLALIMKAAVCVSGATAGGQHGGGEGVSAMGDMMDIIGEAAPADEGSGAPEDVEDSLQNFAGKALDNSINSAKSGKKQPSVDDPAAALEEMKSRSAFDDDGEQQPFKVPDASSDVDESGEDGASDEDSSPAEESSDATDIKKSDDIPIPPSLRSVATPPGSTREDTKKSNAKQDDFLIFGYTLSVTGRMHSVVVAELSDAQRGRYVATVPVDQLSLDELEQLQNKLDEFRADTPALRAPLRARWVIPAFTCSVKYKGRTSVGTLKNPELISYRPIDRPLTQ